MPLVDVLLEEGDPGPPGDVQLWRLHGHVDVADGSVAYDQRLTRHPDGSLVLHADSGAMHIDRGRGVLRLAAETESLARQLVTTFGLPLMLHGSPSLVLHACAAVAPGREGAHVICATSGTGKSSLLVGLMAAGWRPVSEDICVVDLRDGVRVWPGPPWVRRAGDGPPGAGVRFRTREKTAWDIEPWQIDQPVPVEELICMDPPGGDEVLWHPLERSELIAGLARMAIWLDEPEERPAATFGPCVRMAGAVAGTRFRLPVSDDWLETGEAVLREQEQDRRERALRWAKRG